MLRRRIGAFILGVGLLAGSGIAIALSWGIVPMGQPMGGWGWIRNGSNATILGTVRSHNHVWAIRLAPGSLTHFDDPRAVFICNGSIQDRELNQLEYHNAG